MALDDRAAKPWPNREPTGWNEGAVVQDALRHLLRSRPDLKIRLAVHRHRNQEISLEKAANLAGISWARMKGILMEKGETVGIGPETVSDAMEEIQPF